MAKTDESQPKADRSAKYPANRLARETSPYLLLHAHNPVDWYPWGDEAFEKAAAENKLIFLSIGYSSCYWCHVMERESFMDDEVAAALNEHFVSIKVDREERPDVDEIYMTALQVYFSATGSPQSGGWPMTMLLTPEAQPIMGATYLPARDGRGMMGLITLLERIQAAWKDDPDQMRRAAGQITRIVERQLHGEPVPGQFDLDATLLDRVVEHLADRYDPEHGGFGYSEATSQVPKFPEPSNLVFLLDRARRRRAAGQPRDEQAEAMLVETLQKMAAGGIQDHVGGGFHRYSTDRYWQIPHFEKMLYDNALLASVYAEAFTLFGQQEFRRTADGILRFVLREMKSPAGGFYSALDAETDAEEGRYYAWDLDELAAVLTPEQLELVADVYGIGDEGNFQRRHVLLRSRPTAESARQRGIAEEDLRQQLAAVHERLLTERSKRKRPLTDTKVLTAWNGLMIRGLADAGRLLENPDYVQEAGTAAEFVLATLRTPDDRLLRTFGAGKAKLNAYLDDYAFLVDGLIALHQATGETRWLEHAEHLARKQIELFWDDARGGFFFTSSDHETLIARSKDPSDSALPSGNAVSAGNLVYLAQALDRPDCFERAARTLAAFATLWQRAPAAMPRMAVSLAALLEARERAK